MMIVETWVGYTPMFDIGIAPHDVVNFVFIRPRYAPRVCGMNEIKDRAVRG